LGLFKIKKLKKIMLKLHLGCGEIKLKDFVNIDIIQTSAVDRVLDVRKLDYSDNSVDMIYSAHVLEHFSQKEALPVLKEWYRVLKPGSTAVIVVPNFDRCVDWYAFRFSFSNFKYLTLGFFKYVLGFKIIDLSRELPKNLIYDVMGGGETNYDYQIYHRTLFNPRSFKNLAQEIGFSRVEPIDLDIKNFPVEGVDPDKLHWASMAFTIIK